MMQLEWTRDPGRLTLSQATSTAYRYDIQTMADGRALLTIRHAHADAAAQPVKVFTYKTVPAARGGAQRFEDKHGYSETETDRINSLCAKAWDEGRQAAQGAVNPYRKDEISKEG